MKNQRNHARHHVGPILALVGLMIATTLVLSPARLASAQVTAPSWSYTGNLATARPEGHTATLLPNGKVLVAAGLPCNNCAELYDPSTGTWNRTGNLSLERQYHTATLLPNGKVLVAGGHICPDDLDNVPCFDISSAELYDPATGTWSNTGNLTTARQRHTATLLPNGRVLVAGGALFADIIYTLDSAELYDSATGTWSNTGSLNQGRFDQTATLLTGGKVLVAGGGAELYDPATGTWGNTPASIQAALVTQPHSFPAARFLSREAPIVIFQMGVPLITVPSCTTRAQIRSPIRSTTPGPSSINTIWTSSIASRMQAVSLTGPTK